MREETIVIGAGQAGLCASYFLTQFGVPHTVFEAGRVGESWLSQRWDSFCLVTPNWTVQLPGVALESFDADAFMTGDDFVGVLRQFAESFNAPVQTGSLVTSVTRLGTSGFEVVTNGETRCASNVIVCCGGYQFIRRPKFARQLPASVEQVDVSTYRSPGDLPDGSVLVVGSGQSGTQIAEELSESGRDVYLCVGKAGRIPRRYRGRDLSHWQLEMGIVDRTVDQLDSPADRFRGDPHVSGKRGGHTLNLHQLARDGVQLLGSLSAVDGPKISFTDNLADNMRAADDFSDTFCRMVDEYIEENCIDAPLPDDENSDFGGGTGPCPSSQVDLDLESCNIRTVVWATGFGFDFSWVRFPVFDEFGYPKTKRGVTEVEGLYFLGLNWLHTRKSGIILGAGDDAKHVVDHLRQTRTVPVR